jgi:predicted O-methyltransferase YrrM
LLPFPFYNPESSRGWAVESIYNGSLTRWRVSRTLRRMAKDAESRGQSDVGVQNLIYALTVSLRPRRVLEIGTHIGTGAVVVGHALKSNGYGKLITLEPAKHYQTAAASNVRRAGVVQQVEILPCFSFDQQCRERLVAEGPFELIFIDGAHDYDAFRHDIEMAAQLICDNGIIVCHDVGSQSPALDPTGKGGVRQALWDFKEENADFKTIYLEFPVWLNDTGTALVCKERLSPDPALVRSSRDPARSAVSVER